MDTCNINELTLTDLGAVFYPYYLELQKERRKAALKLFEEKKFNEIRVNYIHYYLSEIYNIELKESDLNDTISQLLQIQKDLPENVDHTKVYMGEDKFGENVLHVSYFEVGIADEKECEKLAKCNASETAWKMKHQSNGRDGLVAKILYDKLTQ